MTHTHTYTHQLDTDEDHDGANNSVIKHAMKETAGDEGDDHRDGRNHGNRTQLCTRVCGEARVGVMWVGVVWV